MNNKFDPEQAKKLIDIVFEHGLFLKVHYTDWLDKSDLSRFPELGVGAANVGPEFATPIVRGLEELEEEEKDAIKKANAEPSNFMERIEKAAIEEGSPWKKFAQENLDEKELKEFAHNHSREIAICVGRYVMNNSDVIESRNRLYENIKNHSSIQEPRQFIMDKIQKSIHRYVEAFNL